jgi:hypothetical protein
MKISKLLIPCILLVFSLPYIYGGCVVVYSSGSPDKDKEDRDTSIGFVGIGSQATINPTNAEEIAGSALAGGLTNLDPKISKLNQRSTTRQLAAFRPMRFPLVLGSSFLKIEISPTVINFSPTARMTDSGDFKGSCGGNFSFSLNLNKDSEKFSGRLFYEDYCEHGIKISGETDVDGNFDPDSGILETAEFSFDKLTDGSNILEGQIAIDFSDSPILSIFNAYSSDNRTGDVFWINDYSMNITELIGSVEIEIFGSFYHPKHGYVNLTTMNPLVVHAEDEWPSSGQIVIQGDQDTRAQLTAMDQLHFGIEADTDGDGRFDWDSGILNWHDM